MIPPFNKLGKSNEWSVIGIDCATQPENVGLALAHVEAENLFVDEVEVGSKRKIPVTTILEWIKTSENVLLAFDAPLGWPKAMGRLLADHQAGQPLSSLANSLFHRCTDDEVFKTFGKRPLEVGANLIARTAEAALRMLNELRDVTGCKIPLAWEPSLQNSIWAIEVYPAATLLALGIKNNAEFIESYSTELRIPDLSRFTKQEHICDAIICAYTGADFLNGYCVGPSPEQRDLALKEGWIWARSK